MKQWPDISFMVWAKRHFGCCRYSLAGSAVLTVPGRFFGEPEHLRSGVGAKPEIVRKALAIVGRELDKE